MAVCVAPARAGRPSWEAAAAMPARPLPPCWAARPAATRTAGRRLPLAQAQYYQGKGEGMELAAEITLDSKTADKLLDQTSFQVESSDSDSWGNWKGDGTGEVAKPVTLLVKVAVRSYALPDTPTFRIDLNGYGDTGQACTATGRHPSTSETVRRTESCTITFSTTNATGTGQSITRNNTEKYFIMLQ